ncbi:DUF302 domain-containing protein [Defluviimonas sp. D31]|nr:DUF302 domain-containing protein [Defluviimonas sp. D31]
MFGQVMSNVAAAQSLDIIAEIDHSRLAAEAGEEMPPSRVLIFSDPELDAALMAIDPRMGLDLPLRILAYEVESGGESKLLYSDAAYLEHRYGVTLPQELRDRYKARIDTALAGIAPGDVTVLAAEGLDGDGLITLESPHGFDETLRRLREVVSAQDDTVWFGEVDFDERARAAGVAIGSAQLLLYGGPGPGGRAMANAPSLGLDAFCQKVLVLQDKDGRVRVIMNDLLALAERHDVRKSLPARVINRRIQKTFADALEN